MQCYKMRTGIIFLFTFFLIVSCWNNNQQQGFYDYSRVSYIYRLPIVDPYEITSPDNGVNWIIELKTNSSPSHEAQFLTKIGIHDSMLVVYSPRDLSVPGHPQGWVVVDIPIKEEKIFSNESDYKLYLRQKGVKDMQFRNVNDVFADFDKIKKLPPEWPKVNK